MSSRTIRSTFIRRLVAAYLLSISFSALVVYDVGIDGLFYDPAQVFFVFATGFMAAVAGSWHMLLPSSRTAAAWSTFVIVFVGCVAFAWIDIARREELDGLITVFGIVPQLFVIVMTTLACALIDTRNRA